MSVYKEFDKIEQKGKIIWYSLKYWLYEVEYEDGEKEEFYHNEINAHQDWMKIVPTRSKKSSKPMHLNLGKSKKKTNSRKKYHTRFWKQLQTLSTNAILGSLAPIPDIFEERLHSLSINDIREILTLKKTKWYENLDISEETISTKMIKLCINMLNSNAMTPEEEALGCFTCKKLKNLKRTRMNERLEKRRKLINSWSKECLETQFTHFDFQRIQLYYILTENTLLSVQVCDDLECVTMDQKIQLYSFMQWLALGCHMLNYPKNRCF